MDYLFCCFEFEKKSQFWSVILIPNTRTPLFQPKVQLPFHETRRQSAMRVLFPCFPTTMMMTTRTESNLSDASVTNFHPPCHVEPLQHTEIWSSMSTRKLPTQNSFPNPDPPTVGEEPFHISLVELQRHTRSWRCRLCTSNQTIRFPVLAQRDISESTSYHFRWRACDFWVGCGANPGWR